MIPFFVGYALMVWFFTARHRRTLMAFGICTLGVGGLLLISYLHWLLGYYHPELMIQGLQILMYPYTMVVAAVGFFVAITPRRHDPGMCPSCGYDMHGLGYPVDRCPECGHACEPIRRVYRPSGAERSDLRSSDVAVLSARGPEPGAAEEDHARHHAQEHPA